MVFPRAQAGRFQGQPQALLARAIAPLGGLGHQAQVALLLEEADILDCGRGQVRRHLQRRDTRPRVFMFKQLNLKAADHPAQNGERQCDSNVRMARITVIPQRHVGRVGDDRLEIGDDHHFAGGDGAGVRRVA